jgi:hypothetical protein
VVGRETRDQRGGREKERGGLRGKKTVTRKATHAHQVVRLPRKETERNAGQRGLQHRAVVRRQTSDAPNPRP